MKGNIMSEYKVKNSKGEYFVSWVEKTPVFNRNSMCGERFSETGASNLIKLLSEENIRGCESVPVSASGI